MPPVRWGNNAASSPMHKQTMSPITTTSAMAGMAAAPIAATAAGTMPVTRMVPASPMTKAPHQLVPLLSDVAISAGGPPTAVPDSLICRLLGGLGAELVGVVQRGSVSWLGLNGAQIALEFPRGHLGVGGAGFGP